MIFNMRKNAKSKKGFTLVEFVVAFAVTAVLAGVLSAMIRPVLTAYSANKTKETLRIVSGRLFTAIRKEICDATDVRLAPTEESLPSKTNGKDYNAIALSKDSKNKSKDFYKRLRFVKSWNSKSEPVSESIISADLYEGAILYNGSSDEIQFYLQPVQNATDSKRLTALRVGLILSIGKVKYKEERVFVCENLVVNHQQIYTADCTKTTPDLVSTSKTYYSVWYKGITAA